MDDIKLHDDLMEYKPVLHPTRLSILIILEKYSPVEASKLRKVLDVKWGTFGSHINILEELSLVYGIREFVKDNPRIVLHITPTGLNALNIIRSKLTL